MDALALIEKPMSLTLVFTLVTICYIVLRVAMNMLGPLKLVTSFIHRKISLRIKMKQSEAPWYTLAISEIGIKEIMGIKHNPRIIQYHKTTTLRAETDEVPWCSAFVNWCMTKAGVEGTNSAAARSWLRWGAPIEEPRAGCVVILSRGKGWQGHVGFYVSEKDSGTIKVLGGNQSNKVSIADYPKSRVLGYRWIKMHS